MTKEQSIVDFYAKIQKLNDTVRTGWLDWGAHRERLESISEHIFEVAMLAILMKSQYQYNVDIAKVVYMAVIHELGEITIGDYMPCEIGRSDKAHIEHAAVHELLGDLLDISEIEAIFLEFDEGKTPEARLAFQCDKLAFCIKCKWYDEESCVDMQHLENSRAFHEPQLQQLYKDGMSWSETIFAYNKQKYDFDDNFLAILDYLSAHRIHAKIDPVHP